jgi:hypothetical protein
MADWRQIQARIRKAKAAPDPAAQLTDLYERTHDGMVAFELAKVREKAGEIPSAVQWYTTAAERFRRAQWRTKAVEALTRLGAPVPEMPSATPPSAEAPQAEPEAQAAPPDETQAFLFAPETAEPPPTVAPVTEASAQLTEGAKRRRHRGRRGGRGRRRGKKGPVPTQAPRVPEASATPPAQILEERLPVRDFDREHAARIEERPPRRELPERDRPLEPAGPVGWQVKGRAGDPALVSRMAHLESQLRRLLASSLYKMEEADQAPAGPGVFLVTDTDQTSYYHVEACQTLRIGIANQLRADRRAARGTETLRTKFADHLGISESQVAKYLNQHCAVRWLQLDEGAAALAHFAVAVLRPVLDQS